MTKPILFFLSIVLLLISSCGAPAIDRINNQVQKLTGNQVMIDAPARIISPTSPFNAFPKVRASLGLSSLEKGTDGFELRIWDESKWPRSRLTIIQYSDKKWSARGCIYKYEPSESSFPDSVSAGKFAILKQPALGWNSFVNKLIDLDVLTLKDFKSLPGYDLISDEAPIIVEVAATNFYRYYELPDAERRIRKFPDADKMIKILEALSANFSLEQINSIKKPS